jgi:hypothetical protein
MIINKKRPATFIDTLSERNKKPIWTRNLEEAHSVVLTSCMPRTPSSADLDGVTSTKFNDPVQRDVS